MLLALLGLRKAALVVGQEGFHLGVVVDQHLLPVDHPPVPDNGKCRCMILPFLPFFTPFLL